MYVHNLIKRQLMFAVYLPDIDTMIVNEVVGNSNTIGTMFCRKNTILS